MLWIGIVLYFAMWTLAWPILLAAYAKALLALTGLPAVLRRSLGLMTYLSFAAVIFLPFTAISEVAAWQAAMDEEPMFVVWFVILFLLSVVPGAFFFQKRYLGPLKRRGYFKSR